MDKGIAYQLLVAELEGYRALPYDDLVRIVGQTFSSRKRTEDTTEYDLDIGVFWSTQEPGQILVDGMIGPVDWGSPMRRLDEHFIVSPPNPPATNT
jgi:hypothetical protein